MSEKAESISTLVRIKIRSLKAGMLFTLDDFANLGSRRAVAVTLSRMVSENSIKRIRRGLYMVPKESRFGEMPPDADAIVDVLSKQGNQSYLSGASASNKLGLTTQVPNTVILRGGAADLMIEIGGLKIEIKAGKSPTRKKDST